MKKQKRYICGCHPNANSDKCTNLKGHGLFESDFAKHTPTPWIFDKQSLAIYTNKDEMIATLDVDDFIDRCEANAKLIVRAVNSHEALVKGLLELRDRLTTGQDNSGNSEINQDEIDIINGLLARAEGRV